MPYRSEWELLEGLDNAEDAFLARENRLNEISRYMRQRRERDQQLENGLNRSHAFEILQESGVVNPEVEEELPSNDQFQRAQQTLNKDPRQLSIHITGSISDKWRKLQEQIFVICGAGTGKTFLFNLLKKQVNRCYGKPVVKLVELQHDWSVDLQLPVQKQVVIANMPLLTGDFLRGMLQLQRNDEFLFVDEISMVPQEMLCMIESRLRQLKSPNAFFEGINVLLFGDLVQLPRVRVHRFSTTGTYAAQLWCQFQLVELKQNTRQQRDTTFIDVITPQELENKRIDILQRLLGKVSVDATNEFSME